MKMQHSRRIKAALLAGLAAALVSALTAGLIFAKTTRSPDAVVTSGKLIIGKESHLSSNGKRLRMHIVQPYHMLELSVKTYNKTNTIRALQSGWKVSQIGLYFCYKNPCNTHAAMLRLSPDKDKQGRNTFYLSVLQKQNKGQATSKQCGNHGYSTLFKSRAFPVGKNFRLSIALQNKTAKLSVLNSSNMLIINKLLRGLKNCNNHFAVRSDNLRWTGALTTDGKRLQLLGQ